jgi:hypothetical protein
MAGRARPRLADADAYPEEHQLREILREPAQRGHRTPDRQAGGDDVAAASPIRQPRDRNTERRIEDREHEPRQQTELRIGQQQIRLDPLEQDREDLAVHVAEEIGEGEQRERQAPSLHRQGIGNLGMGLIRDGHRQYLEVETDLTLRQSRRTRQAKAELCADLRQTERPSATT